MASPSQFSDEFLDSLRPYLKEYLKSHGIKFASDRSFHCFNMQGHKNGDRSASAWIIDSHRYKCGACNEWGDIFDAAEKLAHLPKNDLRGKVMDIATRCGITVPDSGEGATTGSSISIEFHQTRLYNDINKDIVDYIVENGNGRKFLTDGKFGRNYTEAQADEILAVQPFGVVSGTELEKHLRDKYADSLDILDKGLVRNGFLDKSVANESRLLFPLYTPQKTVAGFGGREAVDIVHPDDVKPRKYKYTVGFEKTMNPFMLHAAAPFIKASHKVYITEGQFDAITMYLNGFKNTIAIMGSSISSQLISYLTSTFQVYEVVLAFDGDAAGIKGTRTTLELLKGLPVAVSVVNLPEGEDPDSCLSKGITGPFDHPVDAVKYIIDRDQAYNDESQIPEQVRIHNMISFVTKVTTSKFRLREYAGYIAEKTDRHEIDIFHDIEMYLHEGRTNLKFIDSLMDNLNEAKYKSPIEFQSALRRASDRCTELLSSNDNNAASYTIEFLNNMLTTRDNLPPVIVTGLPLLDRNARILCGNLTVWGGRPSNGKSSFIRWLIFKNILKNNPDLKIMYLTMDDDTASTMMTMLSIIMRVSRDEVEHRIADGSFNFMKEFEQTEEYIRTLFKERVCVMGIDQCPTVGEIRKNFEQLRLKDQQIDVDGKKVNPRWMIVVDAVNDLREIKRADDQRLAIEATFGEFTELARSTGASVHLVNHLTKVDTQSGKTPRPDLSDLKGSSAIEHDARTIFLVHMDMHYNKETQFAFTHDGEILPYVEVKVAKDKSRPANEWIPYKFFANYGEFIELSTKDEEYFRYKENIEGLNKRRY